MQKSIQEKSLIENMAEKAGGKLKEYRVVLFSCTITALLTYMYAFTNKLPNLDDVSQLFAKGTTLESGRWGLVVQSYIFPDYSMPWIYGVISIALISIAVCLIIRLLEIRNRVFQALLSALIVAFPSLIGTVNYLFTAASFALSFLLSVAAVYLLAKKRIGCYIAAVVLMTYSLGIYQSYISVAVGLILTLIIKQIIDLQSTPKEILINAGIYLSFLILSVGLWYGITQLIFAVTGTSFGYYANQNLNTENEPIIQRFKIAYIGFYRELFTGFNGLVPGIFSRVLHGVLTVVIGWKGILFIIRKNAVAKKVLFVVALLLFPLGINCMYLITESSAVHTLVMYGFVCYYLLAFVLLEGEPLSENKHQLKNAIQTVSVLACVGIIISNIYLGNELYLNMQLKYENTYSFYTSLVTQIKSSPDFTPGTKVALVGKTEELIYPYDEFGNLSNIPATEMDVNIYSRNQFIRYYTGFDADFADEDEVAAIAESSEFKEMPIYPYYGSMKKIGDCIVVKFSEPEPKKG